MNIGKLSLGIVMSSAICFGGTGSALARSGASSAIYSCPSDPGNGHPPAAPGDREVFLYSQTYGRGTCWAIKFDKSLLPGFQEMWAGYEDGDAGFRNDDIMSVRVGFNVHMIAFWHSFNTATHGATLQIPSQTYVPDLGSWNNNISAIRLGDGPLSDRCTTSEQNRLIIWDTTASNPVFAPDCTVLNVGASSGYPNPASMAFRNDTITAYQVPGGLTREVVAHYNANYFTPLFYFVPMTCYDLSNLYGCGYGTCGSWGSHSCTTPSAGDRISSISVY